MAKTTSQSNLVDLTSDIEDCADNDFEMLRVAASRAQDAALRYETQTMSLETIRSPRVPAFKTQSEQSSERVYIDLCNESPSPPHTNPLESTLRRGSYSTDPDRNLNGREDPRRTSCLEAGPCTQRLHDAAPISGIANHTSENHQSPRERSPAALPLASRKGPGHLESVKSRDIQTSLLQSSPTKRDSGETLQTKRFRSMIGEGETSQVGGQASFSKAIDKVSKALKDISRALEDEPKRPQKGYPSLQRHFTHEGTGLSQGAKRKSLLPPKKQRNAKRRTFHSNEDTNAVHSGNENKPKFGSYNVRAIASDEALGLTEVLENYIYRVINAISEQYSGMLSERALLPICKGVANEVFEAQALSQFHDSQLSKREKIIIKKAVKSSFDRRVSHIANEQAGKKHRAVSSRLKRLNETSPPDDYHDELDLSPGSCTIPHAPYDLSPLGAGQDSQPLRSSLLIDVSIDTRRISGKNLMDQSPRDDVPVNNGVQISLKTSQSRNKGIIGDRRAMSLELILRSQDHDAHSDVASSEGSNASANPTTLLDQGEGIIQVGPDNKQPLLRVGRHCDPQRSTSDDQKHLSKASRSPNRTRLNLKESFNSSKSNYDCGVHEDSCEDVALNALRSGMTSPAQKSSTTPKQSPVNVLFRAESHPDVLPPPHPPNSIAHAGSNNAVAVTHSLHQPPGVKMQNNPEFSNAAPRTRVGSASLHSVPLDMMDNRGLISQENNRIPLPSKLGLEVKVANMANLRPGTHRPYLVRYELLWPLPNVDNIIHVDFSDVECEDIKEELIKIRGPIPVSDYRLLPIRQLANLLENISDIDFDKFTRTLRRSQLGSLKGRTHEDFESFLSDVRRGLVNERPGIIRAKAKTLATVDNQDSVARQIRPIGHFTGLGLFQHGSTDITHEQMISGVNGNWKSWRGASKDVITAAWAPKGNELTYAVGACTDCSESMMQYNQPRNLLLGNVDTNTIKELPDHYVEDASATVTEPVYMTVSAVQFSIDGEQLYTASYDKTVKIWDVTSSASATCVQTLPHNDRVDLLEASAHCAGRFATGSRTTEGAVRVYTVGSENQEQSHQTYSCKRIEERVKRLRYPSILRWGPSEGNKQFLLAGFSSYTSEEEGHNPDKGDLCLWDIETGHPFPLKPSSQSVFAAAWSLEAGAWQFATGGTPSKNNLTYRGTTNSVVRMYDFRLHGILKEYECPASDIEDVVFCPYKIDYVCAATTDGSTYVWDRRFPDYYLHRLEHREPINNTWDGIEVSWLREEGDSGVKLSSWDQNGTHFYTGSSDGFVKKWDILKPPGEAFIEDVFNVDAPIMCGAFSPDNTNLLVGDSAGGVHIIDTHIQPPYTTGLKPVPIQYISADSRPEDKVQVEQDVLSNFANMVEDGEFKVHRPFGVFQGDSYQRWWWEGNLPPYKDQPDEASPELRALHICPSERSMALVSVDEAREGDRFVELQNHKYKKEFAAFKAWRKTEVGQSFESIEVENLEARDAFLTFREQFFAEGGAGGMDKYLAEKWGPEVAAARVDRRSARAMRKREELRLAEEKALELQKSPFPEQAGLAGAKRRFSEVDTEDGE